MENNMNKIITPIRLIYYLLLNDGRVPPQDKDAINLRMTLPMTITADGANEVIQDLLEIAAEYTDGDEGQVKSRMRKFDWCQFQHLTKVIPHGAKKKKIYAKPLKKSNFSGVFRRK